MNLLERIFTIAFARVAFYALTNLMLFASGAVLLWLGVRAAMMNTTTEATAYLAAGLVLLFAATISRFESLKGLGVEAKISQQLNEADAKLKLAVKQSTEMFAAQIIELSSSAGRWDGAPAPRTAYDNAQKIKDMLEQGGSDSATIRKVMGPWVKTTCFDLVSSIFNEVAKLLHEEIQRKKYALSQISPMADNTEAAAQRKTLDGEIATLDAYMNQMWQKLAKFSVEEFPNKVGHLLAQAPRMATNIDHLSARLDEMKDVLLELSTTLTLANPEILPGREQG